MRTTFIISAIILWACIMASQADAHEPRPNWLDAETSPLGTAVMLDHPRVVRGSGQPWLNVRIAHFGDGPPPVLQRLRLVAGDIPLVTFDTPTLLRSLGPAHMAATKATEALEIAARSENRSLADTAAATLHDAMHEVSLGLFNRRWSIPRSMLGSPLCLEIDLQHGSRFEFLSRQILLPVADPLPRGMAVAQRFLVDESGRRRAAGLSAPSRDTTPWLAGDQHLHTRWSLDANVLNGTDESVTGYADTARLVGLDWAFITDHSNIHINWFGEEFYTPEQQAQARAEAAQYRADEGWPVGYSQEIGLGRDGFWDLPSHMLAYPLETFDAPYIENPSSGLLFGHASCENEQVLIDRTNDAGCFGFIAHPYKSGTLTYAEWDWNNGATGWAGLEIWSSEEAAFTNAEVQAIAKWHELLAQIGPPSGGVLPERPDFPTRFPVGVGNSDAHEAGFIGAVFTYARLANVEPEPLREAFLGGRCIASNGPLATLQVNTAGLGEVGLLPDGNGLAVVRLELTEEFGVVGDYDIDLQADGTSFMLLPTDGLTDLVAEFLVPSTDSFADAGYLTITAVRQDGDYRAMTNPVWLQVTEPGDANGDGVVSVADVLIVIDSWGACEGCPSDFDGNGQVDTSDVLTVLAHWSRGE